MSNELMTNKHCAHCRFFHFKGAAGEDAVAELKKEKPWGQWTASECRRFARATGWPMVYGDDWCGEWECRHSEVELLFCKNCGTHDPIRHRP